MDTEFNIYVNNVIKEYRELMLLYGKSEQEARFFIEEYRDMIDSFWESKTSVKDAVSELEQLS